MRGIAIIALAAVIGLSMTACFDFDSDTLDGIWLVNSSNSNYYETITVSGSNGTLSSFNYSSALWQSAVTNNYLKAGDQFWRNLTSTGNLTWSGEKLLVTYNTSNSNVAIGTQWTDATITMSVNGQTITYSGTTDSGAPFTATYTRRQ